MAVKLMYIANDDKQHYPFFKSKLVVETFENKLNTPTNQFSVKLFKKFHYSKTLGTSVKKQLIAPSFFLSHT